VTTSEQALANLPRIVLTRDRRVHNDLMKLPTKELKRILRCYNCSSCNVLEKTELADNILEASSNTTNGEGHLLVQMSDLFKPEANSTCTMCFDEFKLGDLVTRLPCGHFFHLGEKNAAFPDNECCPGVLKWLSGHANSCPNCKFVVPEGEDGGSLNIPVEQPPAGMDEEESRVPLNQLQEGQEQSRSVDSTVNSFVKHQCVYYLNSDRTREPATIVNVSFNEDMEPYYTISLLQRNGQEKCTVQSRLRALGSHQGTSLAAAAAQSSETRYRDTDGHQTHNSYLESDDEEDNDSLGPSPLKRSRS